MAFAGESDCVTLETECGIMQIKPGHADLIGTVDFTEIRVALGAEEEHLLGRKGVVHVDNVLGKVEVLLGYASHYKHVSFASMEEHLKHIEGLLASGENLKDFHVTFLNEERVALEQMVKRGE